MQRGLYKVYLSVDAAVPPLNLPLGTTGLVLSSRSSSIRAIMDRAERTCVYQRAEAFSSKRFGVSLRLGCDWRPIEENNFLASRTNRIVGSVSVVYRSSFLRFKVLKISLTSEIRTSFRW